MRLEQHDAAGDASLGQQIFRQGGVSLKRSMVANLPLSRNRGAVQRHQLALLEHADALTQGLGFFEVMRGQQHGVPFAG